MSWFGDPVIVFSSFLCLFLVFAFIKIFHKLWWTPTRIQSSLAMQGIKGPSYKFIYGSTKDIMTMKKETMGRPMNLSHDILSKVQPHIHLWTDMYGKNFLQWYGSQAQLVIGETELCKEILNNKDRDYPKRKPEAFVKKLLGDGLAYSEGDKWMKLRKLANHAFHGDSLKSMIPTMTDRVETMLERWKDHQGKEIEVYEEFSKILKNNDEIESQKLEKGIRDSIIDIVKKREEKAMTGQSYFGSDFLGLLLQAHHHVDDNKRISVDNLVDECKTFYFAGQETTNTLLAWTVLLLALHPDWQEEARKEVLQVFGKQTPNSDGIAKLKTMSMILNECLRLYPPIASVVRKVQREVKVGKLIVPADIELHIPTLAIHHDPQIWGRDAHLFKPERFSEGIGKATKNNIAAFLPFGMGPRNCVGLEYAITEGKIALSMILQRYLFTLSPGYVHSPFQYITVRPQHGVQVILHKL